MRVVVTGRRRVLLTPGEMGTGEWLDVSERLTGCGYHVLLDTELTYDRGIMSAAGSQLERLRDPMFWTLNGVDDVDLAVGFGIGAGPAAAMVADGRATSAILIDPDLTMLAMTHPDDLDVLTYEAAFELAGEMVERLEPFNDNLRHGPFTREMVNILCGAFTGQAWRIERADRAAPFCMDRITIDRSQRPTEADQHASDWASFAARTSVSVWLTAGNEALAGYLRTSGLDVTLTAWSQAPWIQAAEELAAAIQNQVDEIHAFNDADVSFAQMKIPYDQQTIKLSDMVLAKEGVDPRVTDLARQIKDAQTTEVTQMRDLLAAWGASASPSMDTRHDLVGGMVAQAEMQKLERATGADSAGLFLNDMIEHHQSVIDNVAQPEIDNGDNARAQQLAQTGLQRQAAEIKAMKRVLSSL